MEGPEACCGVTVTTIVHKLSADWPTTQSRDLCAVCADEAKNIICDWFNNKMKEVAAR